VNFTEIFKYRLVSFDSMNTQINLRISDELLDNAREYAKKHGFGNVQDLIKESLREKVFEEPDITKEEIQLVKRFIEASKKKNLYSTEEELFKRLRKKQ